MPAVNIKNPYFFSLFIIIFSLLFVNCFDDPSDIHDIISEDIAWANASKLNVRIEYDTRWGTSNPARGIMSADIRQGFAFPVEFASNSQYALVEWRAYRGLITDLSTLDETQRLDDVIIPWIAPRGGIGQFTINANEKNITLVAWCEPRPYVIRTEPRNDPSAGWTVLTDIVIQFNSALSSEMIWECAQDSGIIDIQARPSGTDAAFESINDHYGTPRYIFDSRTNSHTVIIAPNPNRTPPENHDIKVAAGPLIFNTYGEKMINGETFYFRTLKESERNDILEWGARYNESSNNILVWWTASQDGRVDASYRLNNGPVIPISEEITGVGRIDVSSVLQGVKTGNVQEYTITLDFYNGSIKTDAREIKIWNIPGMENSSDKPLVEIRNQRDLAAISESQETLKKNYALTRNITIDSSLGSAWTPIGKDASSQECGAFQGKLYGNGYTITFDSGRDISLFSDSSYTGIFGYVNNAQIRDLELVFASDVGAGGSDSADVNKKVFGSLVGRMDGESVIQNVIVRGSSFVGLKSTAENIYAGGICGYMQATAQIINSYMDITLNVTGESGSSNTDNALRAAGIVGFIEDIPSVSNSIVMIDRARTAGSINVAHNNSALSVFLGGLTGESCGRGIIRNASVSGNLQLLTANTRAEENINYICAGIIGKMSAGLIDNCEFTGQITFPAGYSANSASFAGGITGKIESSVSSVTIKNSTANGNLSINNAGSGITVIGGVCANANSGANQIRFENNEYRGGSIIFSRTGNSIAGQNIGGFVGEINGDTQLINCRSIPSLIEINSTANAGNSVFNTGGFAGLLQTSADSCYSISVIEVNLNGSAVNSDFPVNVGGFAGAHNGSMIKRSFALGSVTVQAFSSDVTNINAGGFAGFAAGGIEDCYARTDVVVDRPQESTSEEFIFAGGFAGHISGSGASVTRIFATGNVTAQAKRDANKNTLHLYAGGIMGFLSAAALQNSVAPSPIGQFITIRLGGEDDYGTYNNGIGRITGGRDAGAITNNFACESIELAYGKYGELTVTRLTNLTDTVLNGVTISPSTSQLRSFWESTVVDRPGFSSSIWNYVNLVSRRYPLLIGLGDQQ